MVKKTKGVVKDNEKAWTDVNVNGQESKMI